MDEQRLIKFRGQVEGAWDYATPDDAHWDQFWALVKRETVGQYVGLKDKNDKEVYEGDIVRFCWRMAAERAAERKEEIPGTAFETAEVAFEEGYQLTPFCIQTGYDGETWLDQAKYSSVDGFEVIGNIYETPKLIPKRF